ncbi:MAG TPA: hypothetical protein VEQ63_13010 [Bryobacteraceae bacterium]|nr:hypothetical protein [Bryobacteraceae bacterium]
MKVVACLVAMITAAALYGTRTDYVNVKRKFASIEQRQTKPGSRVPLTSSEINAYVETELPQVAPPGVRKPRVELHGNNTATGSLVVDFLKLRSAKGKSSNWLLRKLLEGEHEVKATALVRSGGGTATVDLQRVEVGGIPISGAALDFLIRNYLVPNYPEAKIGRPFQLHKQVDRLEVQPGIAYVVLKR